ncbi:hypothetical protein [Ruminococcus sp. XPD3002]|uniref:hypothetical protein n=1 Tax=Ruminococcus sp. XPD3002 TaxID=1452269 RepID=UPI000913203F|nr:hypothetical protein SAMN04487832_12611 [Ruminococcus flavefaciens]
MAMTNEEKELLRRLESGALDGIVWNGLTTSGGSSICKAIKNDIPEMFKPGPGGKFFMEKRTKNIAEFCTLYPREDT